MRTKSVAPRLDLVRRQSTFDEVSGALVSSQFNDGTVFTGAGTNLVYTGQGRQVIYHKLDRIRLNEVKYDGLELSEVIRNLSDETRKRDPDKTGINFLILADPSTPAPARPPGPTSRPSSSTNSSWS